MAWRLVKPPSLPRLNFSVGFVIAAYGTINSHGGGFLYVPLLLFLYPAEHHGTLTAIALAVNFFTSSSGMTAYVRQKRIDYKSGLWFAAATIPGAILGVIATHLIARKNFEGIFSVFLIGLAPFMFFRPKSDTGPSGEKRPPAAGGVTRVFQSTDGITFEYPLQSDIGT